MLANELRGITCGTRQNIGRDRTSVRERAEKTLVRSRGWRENSKHARNDKISTLRYRRRILFTAVPVCFSSMLRTTERLQARCSLLLRFRVVINLRQPSRCNRDVHYSGTSSTTYVESLLRILGVACVAFFLFLCLVLLPQCLPGDPPRRGASPHLDHGISSCTSSRAPNFFLSPS